MKKFFALVLAVAMVMSLASVAMAADVTLGLGAYDYSADSNTMTLATGFFKDANGDTKGALLTYGDTVYFPLKIAGEYVKDFAAVEKLKVKVSYEMGEDLVKDVEIVKVRVDDMKKQDGTALVTADYFQGADYYYFVAFKTNSMTTTGDSDVVGTLEFNRKEIKAEDAPKLSAGVRSKIDECEVDFAFNLFYENSWLTGAKANAYVVDGKAVALKWDTDYALKFDYDDEAEFNFGFKDLNEGSFVVDVSGQGKVYVRYNTKAVDAIVDANPGVNMHFINFNDVKFNRTGEFTYELEDGVAAYKVVDGALVEIPGLENDDGEFTFNTRVLGSYVFATAELVNPVVEAPVVAPEVTNPTTGA
ncbi:MAG: hypothetical protein IJF25_00115 [Oscillospiraceae bacterium]|nr:hypothetical protein [Oscillospiraceae bacterium]